MDSKTFLADNWKKTRFGVLRNIDNEIVEQQEDVFANLGYLTGVVDLWNVQDKFPGRKVNVNFEFPSIQREYNDGVRWNHAAMDRWVKLSNHENAKLTKICLALWAEMMPVDATGMLKFMKKELFNQPIVVYSQVNNWYDKIVWYSKPTRATEPFTPSLGNVYLNLEDFVKEELENAPEFIKKMVSEVPEYVDLIMGWGSESDESNFDDSFPF